MSIEVNIKGQPVELFDTDQLAVFHNKTDKTDTFLLDMFFPNKRAFETTDIPMGELDTSTPIAPLVAPSVEGRIMVDKAKYGVQYVTPAYLKPAGMITPQNVNDIAMLQTLQQAGFIGNARNMSDAEKLRVAQVAIYARNRQAITNFNVQAAAKILIDGKITFKSKDFPEVTVDFGRHADLKFAPTTTWDAAGATPVDDINTMIDSMVEHGGTTPEVALMSSKTFTAFAKTEQYKEQFVKPNGANAPAPLNAGTFNSKDAKFRGELDGIQFWTYDATYRDEAGTVTRYIGDKSFYLIADLDGFLCNCSLQNLDVLGVPLDVYDYAVEQKDPSGVKQISESSPLPVPSNPNGVAGGDAFIA